MMTEAEWVRAADAEAMLPLIEKSLSSRKLRLFMAGVGRYGWEKYRMPAIYEILDCADRYVDDKDRFGSALHILRTRTASSWFWGIPTESLLCPPDQEFTATHAFVTALRNSVWIEKATVAAILRDIAGNPFSPIDFSSSWQTSNVLILAREMYKDRDFRAMPILADAFQDAGCDNDDILAHCRDTSLTHVCGCWVIDLVLGK